MAAPILAVCLFLALGSSAIAAPEVYFANRDGLAPYFDRECGGTVENMWLEIVFVVDNSLGMTTQGLGDVAANMLAVMGGVNIGIDPSNPRTTRVGIVLYNKNATIVANLDTFKSTNDFINSVFANLATQSVSTYDESYLSQGLAMAEQVLQDGSRDDRELFKKVVVVYASTYDENGNNNPLPVANRLKTDDIKIATAAYAQKDEGALLQKLSKIATPHLNFTNSDSELPAHLQNGLVQANCFCPNGWRHYQETFSDVDSKKFGICIKPVVLSSTWVGAKMNCNVQWKNGYLVNEYTQHKHDFVLDAVRSNPTFKAPYKYLIGLSYYNNNWYWEQPFGTNGRPFTTGSWTDWNPGFPVIDSTRVVSRNNGYNQSLTSVGWENIDRVKTTEFYVCEVISCDTDNYCQSDPNN